MSSSSPRRRLRLLLATAAAVAVGSSLAACGGSGSGASGAPTSVAGGDGGTSNAGGSATLNWGYLSDQPNWDPVVVGPTSATQLLSLIYEPLFTKTPDGKIGPALATSYKYASDGKSLVITLRPNLTFQDGSPLDAAAVAYNIHRIQTQSNSALKADWQEVTTTKVIDKTHLQINLAQKDYQIPFVLANRSSLLASEKAAQADPAKLNSTDPVGAGPFKLVKLTPDASLTLEKWPGYWDAKDIHIDKVNLTLNVDPSTVLSDLQTGTYNFVGGLPAQDLAIAQKDGLNVVSSPTHGWTTDFLSVNRTKAPFNNPKVYEALQYAINRDAFVQQSFGTATSAFQPFPSTYSPVYNASFESSYGQQYAFDLDKAKQLLASSGVPASALSVELDVIQNPTFNSTEELLQQQLQAAGFTVKINNQDINTYYKGYYGKTDQLSLYGYVGRDSQLEALDEFYTSAGILNLSGTTAPQYAAARQKVLGLALDSPKYAAALQAATEVGVSTGSTIPLFSAPQAYVTASSVSSLPAIDGVYRWNGVTIGGQ